jgi:hypothetical protein
MAGAVVAGGWLEAGGGDPDAGGGSSAQAAPAPSANTNKAAATTDDRVMGSFSLGLNEMESGEGNPS